MYNTYDYDRSQSNFINKTLLQMAIGLFITFIVGFFVSMSPAVAGLVYSNRFTVIVLAGIELAIVVMLSGRLEKMSYSSARMWFFIYSVINGLTFSVVFIAFDLGSVASVFLVASAMFFCCSMIGLTAKRDLSFVGRIAIMGLIGIIVASIINIFTRSAGMYAMINYIGVAVFCALTAYDMQKVKHIHQGAFGMDPELVNKLSVVAALSLYLDFINLFYYLLRIFGDRD